MEYIKVTKIGYTSKITIPVEVCRKLNIENEDILAYDIIDNMLTLKKLNKNDQI